MGSLEHSCLQARLLEALQSMTNPLTQEPKACSTLSHPFHPFQRLPFSLNSSIALGKRESCCHGCCVSYPSSNTSLQRADSACFHVAEPIIEPLTRARAKHLRQLLDHLIRLIDFGVQRPKEDERFWFFSRECFMSTKNEKQCVSCQHSRTWKLIRSLLLRLSLCKGTSQSLRPPFWKGTGKPPLHTGILRGGAISSSFSVHLSDRVAASFPSFDEVGQMGINAGLREGGGCSGNVPRLNQRETGA